MPDENLRYKIITEADLKGVREARPAFEDLEKAVRGAAEEAGDPFADAQETAREKLEDTTKAAEKQKITFTELNQAYQFLGEVARKVWGGLSEAARQQGIREEFQRLAEQAGMTSQSILSAMDEAAAGTISANQMMANANRFLVSGMQITSRQMSDLLLIARDRARAMGISVTQAFDDITTGITRSAPLVLDNLGIIVKQGEANQRLADQLGKTVEQLTAQERSYALLNQVLQDNAEGVQRLRGETQGLGDQMAIAEATIDNLGTAIGAFFAETEAGSAILDTFNEGLTALSQVAQLALMSFAGAGAFADTLARTGDASRAATAAYRAQNEAMYQMQEALGNLPSRTGILNDEFQNLAQSFQNGQISAQDFQAEWRALVEQVGDQTLARQLKYLPELLAANGIGVEHFGDAVYDMLGRMGEIPKYTEPAGDAIQSLTDVVVDNAETMQRAADRLANVNKEITGSLQGLDEARRDQAKWLTESEEKNQQKLADIALKGVQARQDIERDGQDKLSDLWTKNQDKLADIASDTSDERLDIEQDYYDRLEDLRNKGGRSEQEAIRRRDARALTEARTQRADELRDIQTDRQRDLRDLVISEQRKLREQQTAQMRGLRDLATTNTRRLRDQQTAEQRSIQMQVAAFSYERQARIAAFNQEVADYQAQYNRLLQQRAAFARNMNGIRVQQTVTNPLTGQQVNHYDVGAYRATSNGRSRTATNR